MNTYNRIVEVIEDAADSDAIPQYKDQQVLLPELPKLVAKNIAGLFAEQTLREQITDSVDEAHFVSSSSSTRPARPLAQDSVEQISKWIDLEAELMPEFTKPPLNPAI